MSADEELLGLMRGRRSVRKFRQQPPDRRLLEELIEAAVLAPSASNQQPWRFFVVRNAGLRARLADAVRQAVDRIAVAVRPPFEGAFRAYGDYFTRFESAPVVIAFLYRGLPLLSHMVEDRLPAADRAVISALETNSGLIGASLALQNLLLMAHAKGLGASGMTGPLVAAPALRELLEVPPGWELAALVPVGYPDEEPAPTARKPSAGVVRWIG